MENLKVVYWKDGRYIIIDSETGEVIDDAQGYGYKDKIRASKALWWKFKNGKEKTKKEEREYKKWIKEPINSQIAKQIVEFLEYNIKENPSMEDAIKDAEERYGIKIPKEFKKFIF